MSKTLFTFAGEGSRLLTTGTYIIKLFNTVINAVMCSASVFVIVKNFLFNFTDTLAFYITELITDVKSFTIQAPGLRNNMTTKMGQYFEPQDKSNMN
jgi:hypothetical protein